MVQAPPPNLDKKINLKVIAPPKQQPNKKRVLMRENRSRSESPKKPVEVPLVPLSQLAISQPLFDETVINTQDISAHTTEPGSLRETMIFGKEKGIVNGEWVRLGLIGRKQQISTILLSTLTWSMSKMEAPP